jgi:anti-sigma factor ChrR (cupin superfamily)
VSPASFDECDRTAIVSVYALDALPSSEVPALEAHISACSECRRELADLRRTVDSFVFWPTDVLRPWPSLWGRLASRIGVEIETGPGSPAWPHEAAPGWQDAAPGISCKLLATDAEASRVSMLVRLAPGTDYPAHRHEGVEELHLLQGELWINERKLDPGDYYRAEPDSEDHRVWSETGCTCVLVTSTRDLLR